jgi:peptidoglycan/xylan/chitin deacetylase (PgdA/CDA1 family)
MPGVLTARRVGCVLACCMIVASCTPTGRPRHQPPAGLVPDDVPLFVVFGSDDNGSVEGLEFLSALFADRRNPVGTGDVRTFDGRPIHYSFYVNTKYIAPDGGPSAYDGVRADDPVLVRGAWLRALGQGHEIGVHTHSHPHGRELSVEAWEEEMTRCRSILARPVDLHEITGQPNPSSGVGVGLERLLGFRTPFLELSDRTIEAVHRVGFVYDCSLEEGTRSGDDASNLPWPYTLDHGSPGNPEIGHYPGLWEIPVYAYLVPPDHECAALGVAPGLRERLRRVQAYFDPEIGVITGMDWNLWLEFAMTPAEFQATIRYSLRQRLRGNRCPLTVGLHSWLYADAAEVARAGSTAAQRRAALIELLDEMLQIPDLRVVSAAELLEWLQQPVALR